MRGPGGVRGVQRVDGGGRFGLVPPRGAVILPCSHGMCVQERSGRMSTCEHRLNTGSSRLKPCCQRCERS